MTRILTVLSFFILACSTTPDLKGQINFATRIVADNLFIPWEIIYGPDDHIWFTQKNGYICRLDPASGQLDTLHHEEGTVIRGEGGMLGLALHPDFDNQPYVYLAYQYLAGSDYKERVVRYTFNEGELQLPEVLLDDIIGASIHNGCRLLIVEDQLFITTGDASNTSLPQDVHSVNGKILRINLDGSIPGDNPIPGNPVWTWGHRNAQGLVAHNGLLYSSEHGPNNDDEINIVKKGRNYGWPVVNGFCDQPGEMDFCNDSNVVEPLIAWTPTIAPAGLEHYHHALFPSLQNSLLLATLKDNNLYQLKLNGTGDSVVESIVLPGIDFGRLRDICIAPDGRIFLSTSNSAAGGGGNKVDQIIELYDPGTSVDQTGSLLRPIQVYPNPVQHTLFFDGLKDLHTPGNSYYALFNLQGSLVREAALEHPALNVEDLPQGLYILHILQAGKERHFFRFVKL
jgi:glucose/arabinose dehydrogenase